MGCELSRQTRQTWGKDLHCKRYGAIPPNKHLNRLRFLHPHLLFDRRCQGVDVPPDSGIEFSRHQFDAEMSFDFENELHGIDRINFQITTDERLIVAQIFNVVISEPEALYDYGF